MKWLLLTSALALGLSYFVEFGLDIQPCFLCLIQRTLFALLFLASLIGIFTRFKLLARRACLVILSLNFLTASYHTLVQLKVVEDRCKRKTSIEDTNSYKTLLQAKKTLGCSENGWNLAPLLNAIVSIALFGLLFRRRLG